MSRNYLIDSFTLEYAGKEFHANYQTSSDKINQKIAGHEFIKVDGAYQEFMGSGADAYRFGLVFVGLQWRSAVTAAVAHFKKNPKGILVHPIHGRKRVAWTEMTPVVDVPGSVNSASCQVQFVEDNLDPAAGQPQTVAGQTQALTDWSSVLDDVTSGSSTQVRALVASVVLQSTAYAAAALSVSQTGIPNAGLGPMISSIQSDVNATLTALDGDSSSDSNRATARTAAIQTYAAALAVDSALQGLLPQFEVVKLGAAISLARLCSDRYGADAGKQRDLIVSLNRIPRPSLMPAGTQILVPVASAQA